MSKIEQLLIRDVVPGDVLATDIFVDRQLLMKKESILTEKALDLLKKKNVQFISIYYKEPSLIPTELTVNQYKVEETKITEDLVFNFSNSTIANTVESSFDFYSLLAELDIEIRYGQILKDESNIDYLQNTLNSILSNATYKDYLVQLKRWDYYSYLHCIDAFIIGTLFARKLGLNSIQQLATGYLLHDIGKLKIPQTILQKPGRLTAKEFDLMKSHTLEGEIIFKQIGLTEIAYLAKSHHERRNGEGYPESAQAIFTTELEILQIIDVYSAITMKRSHRDAMRAADAFSLLYRDEDQFNGNLLTQFVDFIGIYPENSIVLLSDGFHGIVEKTNQQFPTSPRVKCMETNTSFHISINNDITILKMISYQTVDKTELLNKFYNELVSANVESAKKTYLKLVDNFKTAEYFTKIFIPVYQILYLLKMQKAIHDTKYTQVIEYMEQLMEQKIDEQIENDQYIENILILVDDSFQHDYFFKVFIGLVHNERLFPHVMSINSNLDAILTKLDTVDFSKTCVISGGNTDTLLLTYLPNMFEVSRNKLEQYLLDLISDNKDRFEFDFLLQELSVQQNMFI